MKTIKDQVAVEATMAQQAWTTAFGAVMSEIAVLPTPRTTAGGAGDGAGDADGAGHPQLLVAC
ncbi:hypothetical protein [Streptomyces sp. NPDC060027]|uniref:hypothetical protein n=1 Tax=Streptomyces sp. NPDC060027 TaxID=3347040 RepID=UPI0036CAEA9C